MHLADDLRRARGYDPFLFMSLPKRKVRAPEISLIAWLDEHHKTQVWLAHRLGISVASMSRITRGISMPRPRLALRIEAITGIPIVVLARAKAATTPFNRKARIRQAKALIARGSSLLASASEEAP